jgi:hypothetical protein
MATLGPESQIDFRNLTASDESGRLKIGHLEDVLRNFEDVIAAVANDSTQRGLFNLSQLFRFENARIFVPKSGSRVELSIKNFMVK